MMDVLYFLLAATALSVLALTIGFMAQVMHELRGVNHNLASIAKEMRLYREAMYAPSILTEEDVPQEKEAPRHTLSIFLKKPTGD